MSRLSVLDEYFVWSHRGLGTPTVMQAVLRYPQPIGRPALAAVHAGLRGSLLGRRVVPGAVPGARPRWQPTVRAYPLDYRSEPIDARDVARWAWQQPPDVGPQRNPGWHLCAAPLADGGTVVVLTCSHALADARGLILAVDQAITGAPCAPDPPAGSDWADARRMWRTVLGGTVRAALRSPPPPLPPRSWPDPPTVPAVRLAVLDVPAAAWDAAAGAIGVDTNSMFVALTTAVLWAGGYPADEVTAGIPVDLRDDGSVANRMTVAPVSIRRGDSIATVHAACRTAIAAPTENPTSFPAELLQVLPDRVGHRLAAGAGQAEVLCSNIGTVPPTLTRLDGQDAGAVAARAIHPGLTLRRFPRNRLSAYLCRHGDTYTLALVSLDPDRVSSDDALAALAIDEFARLGLTARRW